METPVVDPLRLEGFTAENFDIVDYLGQFDSRLLLTPEGRRIATRTNPFLFALLYLRKHLKDKNQEGKPITFAECHFEWCRIALTWVRQDNPPMGNRHAVIAPRETGKSTWFFLILPLWAAAHGHVKFVAAFAHSASQAQTHLKTFKRELDHGFTTLWNDFPELCEALKRPRGQTVSDNAGMIHQKSGFVFAARGIDAASLGMKVGEQRPDLIILDDIEPGEANYSAYQVEQRLTTLRDDILYLNLNARVVWPGTVTMSGSLMHQMVRMAKGEETEQWLKELRFTPHYHQGIITNADGTDRSIWPAKWPLEMQYELRGTHDYAKNFDNDPIDNDDMWWRKEDIKYLKLPRYDRTVLIVDGAVTTKKTSDQTGLAVVGLDISGRRFFVREAIGVRQSGEALRETVLNLIEQHNVSYIMVEANQAGDLWHLVFHDMPVKVETFRQSERKEYRIKRLLAAYQRAKGAVYHERTLTQLERQALAYPRVQHDDILDATAAGVWHLTHMLLRAQGKNITKAEVRQFSYI